MSKIRVAILFSGRGSNMRALANHMVRDDIKADWVLAISNRPDAAGIKFCKEKNVPCAVIDHTDYDNRGGFEAEMQKALIEAKIELICCAGFMRLLTANFVNLWHDRLLNIHPSLLPAYKGLNTHERALEDGATEHGCTVHYMRPEMDDGPTLVQKRVAVQADDTPDSLAARVLEQEHIAYPEALDLALTHLRRLI